MNVCSIIVTSTSRLVNIPIRVMEYANISFLDNACNQLIAVELDKDYREQFPLCVFQYFPSNTLNASINFVPLTHFTIIIKQNINFQISISWIIHYSSH